MESQVNTKPEKNYSILEKPIKPKKTNKNAGLQKNGQI